MDFIPLSFRVVTPLSGSSWTALCCLFSSWRTRFWKKLDATTGKGKLIGHGGFFFAHGSARFFLNLVYVPLVGPRPDSGIPTTLQILRAQATCSQVSPSSVETRSTWQTSCVLRDCVGVGVIRYAYHLAQILRAQATRFQCPPAQFIAVGDSNQKYFTKSLCLSWLCWFWRHAAITTPGKYSASSGRSQVKRSASQRAHREHAPNDVVGKFSPCEVAESAIGRPQNTNFVDRQ